MNEGRKEVRKDDWREGRTNTRGGGGRKEGRMIGRMEGRLEGRIKEAPESKLRHVALVKNTIQFSVTAKSCTL
jgi:hypothetical protein